MDDVDYKNIHLEIDVKQKRIYHNGNSSKLKYLFPLKCFLKKKFISSVLTTQTNQCKDLEVCLIFSESYCVVNLRYL